MTSIEHFEPYVNEGPEGHREDVSPNWLIVRANRITDHEFANPRLFLAYHDPVVGFVASDGSNRGHDHPLLHKVTHFHITNLEYRYESE